ncbi:MAG TPA: hypothetical protein VFW34_09160 [Candidatus Rubrimentiphilum sp.]|nr:hypothetical protein [Candidatus Rubrimentiphilum sp.]
MTRISDVVVVKDAALLSWDIGTAHGLMGLLRQHGRWWDALDVYRSSVDCWDNASTSYPLQGGMWLDDFRDPSPASLLRHGLPGDVVSAAASHNDDIRTATPRAAPVSARSLIVRPHCMTEYYRVNKIQAIDPAGGALVSFRPDTAGYGIDLHYAPNDSRGATFHLPYARAPTAAEIIPYPTTLRFISTSVLYFDLTIDSSKPVTFAPGTTIDIWFPFVLDDTLNYDLTIGFAQQPIGPVYAKPFDNVLHYKLPGFTVLPGQTLMAEVDGNWP